MADAIDIPQPTNLELGATQRPEGAVNTAKRAGLTIDTDGLLTLKQHREASRPDLVFLSESQRRQEQPFNFGTQTNKLRMLFGAGKARKDSDGNPKEPIQRAARESFNRASDQIAGLSSVVDYINIRNEADRTGRTIRAVMDARSMTTDEFRNLRNSALSTVLRAPEVHDMLPELWGPTITDHQRQIIIENMFLTDPKFSQAIEAHMGQILKAAQDIAKEFPDKTSAQERELEAKKRAKDEERNSVVRKIKTQLSLSDSEEEILNQIKDSDSVDSIKANMLPLVLRANGVTDPQQVLTYVEKAKATELFRTQIKQVEDQINFINRSGLNDRNTPIRDELLSRKAGYEAELKIANDYKQAIEKVLGKTPDEMQQQLVTYRRCEDLLDGIQDDKGRQIGGIDAAADQFIQAGKDSKDIQAKIDANPSSRILLANRLDQESAQVQALQDVIGDSLVMVMADRNREYMEAQQAKAEKAAADKEKQGQAEEANQQRSLERSMRKNWITVSGQGEKQTQRPNPEAIGRDIRFTLYHGAEGTQRLILRDSEIPLVDNNGNPLKDADGNDVTYATVDLDTLGKKQQGQLATLYEENSEAYENALLKSLALASTTGGKKLRLQPYEAQLFRERFEKRMEEDIARSPALQETVKALEAQNIAVNRSEKSKWKPDIKFNLWLALLLMGTASISAGGTIALQKAIKMI